MLRPQATIRLLDMLPLYFFDKLSYSIWPKEFISTKEIPQLETVTVTFLIYRWMCVPIIAGSGRIACG